MTNIPAVPAQVITSPQRVKRITSIQLENFRAFYGAYEPILLSNGENLLIYGENGSGKTSLFKALNNYLASSRDNTFPFVKNRHSLTADGEVKIGFKDFTLADFQEIPGTNQEYQFGSINSTNNVLFLQNAVLIKGFLDYRDLLDVYFHKEAQPNLFKLIVLSLLGNHIPLSSGGNFRFNQKWTQLQADLIENAYTRNSRCHQIALGELSIYQFHLKSTLNDVFTELNRMLSGYFQDLNIELGFTLENIAFNYGRKWDWHTTADLRLTVKKDNIIIQNDYTDILNEARLSAFAICLYLASLKRNPSRIPLKILYLDDVFVGLDAGNRIPILNILKNEFSDYQIFISTYDRHWFELAKRQFQIEVPGNWLTAEFYVGKATVGNTEFDKPIIVIGDSHYEKANQYLHHRSKPDYPAAANYFRKALEDIIQRYIPKWEIADSENTQIPGFQLTSLAHRTKSFLDKTDNDSKEITKIIGLLHTLLHPLSHHEITSPIYKAELIIIESCIAKLKDQLIALDIPNNYKCCLESGKRLKMTFIIDVATNHYSFYELILKESLTLKRNTATSVLLSKGHCVADRCYGYNNTVPYPSFNPDKKKSQFNYVSLASAYDRIYNHLINTPAIGNFSRSPDYLNTLEYYDGTNWQSLTNLIVVW